MGIEAEYALAFVMSWAEAVLRQMRRIAALHGEDEAGMREYVARVRARYEQTGVLDVRDRERDHEEGRIHRQLWVEEHALVGAAYQLEKWQERLADADGEERPLRDPVLAILRNALEHLDDADIDGRSAVPGPRSALPPKKQALAKLPGGSLPLVPPPPVGSALLDREALKARARAALQSGQPRLDQMLKEYEDSLQWESG